jgi:myosin heavy subunit
MDGKKNDCDEVKLRNLKEEEDGSSTGVGSVKNGGEPIGLVHDLIHLTHLHEPAILHSLRLRYDGNVIYTSTGPILIAINPFKSMEGLYGEGVMEEYRRAGEGCRYVIMFFFIMP